MLLEHREEDIGRGDWCLPCLIVLPNCPVDLSIRMLIKQDVPKEWVPLLVETGSNDVQPGSKGEVFQVRVFITKHIGPIAEPLLGSSMVCQCMIEGAEQMGFAESAFTQSMLSGDSYQGQRHAACPPSLSKDT